MRWKPFRITELWAKAVFIGFGWMLIPTGLRYVLTLVSVPPPAILLVDVVWGFAVVWFGSRVFRITGEPLDPPRRWWRATGRPPAGFVIFGLFALSGVAAFLPSTDDDPALWWYLVTSAPLAAFYLHSSIRLVRGDAPVPPRATRDDDSRFIDRRSRF